MFLPFQTLNSKSIGRVSWDPARRWVEPASGLNRPIEPLDARGYGIPKVSHQTHRAGYGIGKVSHQTHRATYGPRKLSYLA